MEDPSTLAGSGSGGRRWANPSPTGGKPERHTDGTDFTWPVVERRIEADSDPDVLGRLDKRTASEAVPRQIGG